MKKNILNKIAILAIVLTASCSDPEDLVTKDAKEGGALLSVEGSEGKLLGIADPATGVITFTDNDLVFNVSLVMGQFEGESFTLVKQFNDQEVEIENFTELPYEYSISSVAEFLDGFTGVTTNDLRIGDEISFKTKIHTKDGRTVYSNDAKVNVKVSCGSDLADTYTMTGLYNRPLSGIVGQVVGPKNDQITKYGVNLYGTQFSGHFAGLPDLGFDPCPVMFTVTCGIIEIPEQNLCNAYGNVISGDGHVDESTGTIYLNYQMTGGNLRTYTFVYTRI